MDSHGAPFVAQLAPPYPTVQPPHIGTLVALVLFIAASVWLGTVAQRVVERSSFIRGYFQGNRGLGAWTIALTATVQSGGTFMGFPSLVYTYGWIVALWIGSYMVVPITGFALIGKRIAQISRRTGAVTMPDLFRARFASPTAGLLSSLLIILFMAIMMIAQFKAGATVMKEAWPMAVSSPAAASAVNPTDQSQAERWRAWWDVKWPYLVGLVVFSLAVVGYTLIGGFLAAVWTDLLQSVMMFLGVMLLACLVIPSAGGLEQGTRRAIAHAGPQFAAGPGVKVERDSQGAVVREVAFLPLTMAFSMFCFWPFAGTASPASVVRIMACKNTTVLRRSIFLLAVYNMGIYLPLIAICICGRGLMPHLGKDSDSIVPRLALSMTQDLPLGSWLAGLILAAPFGAIMATVSCYLLVIASGLVRDIYQRFVNPEASERDLRRLTYLSMALIGLVAMLLNIEPVEKLQMLVTFSSGCAAAAFLIPTLMMCYWRRASAAGAISAMLGGALVALSLNLWGLFVAVRSNSAFVPYNLLGFEPIVWGLLVSLVVGIVVSLVTQPPEEAVVSRLFDATSDLPSAAE